MNCYLKNRENFNHFSYERTNTNAKSFQINSSFNLLFNVNYYSDEKRENKYR
jgi:hypothetical protein